MSTSKSHIVAIIPARYGSTRFPGKPLALVGGVTMIERVVRRVQGAGVVDRIVVATDDKRIQEAVLAFGGEVIMTPVDCRNGTFRCHSAMMQLDPLPDAILNVQGDEPFVHPEQLKELVMLICKPDASIATLAHPMKASDPGREDPNRVKVLRDLNGRSLYFSRSPIPHGEGPWLQHVGLYAFTRSALEAVVKLHSSELEERENLEQLRWMSHGWSLDVGTTHHRTPSVDTPEDLAKIEELLGSGWTVD
jgi:3-deoxy-manno-octulosonate cytidylyltransferase (CMP-KDO synthetase)